MNAQALNDDNDENMSEGYGSVRRRLVKMAERVDSFNVKAMAIVGSHVRSVMCHALEQIGSSRSGRMQIETTQRSLLTRAMEDGKPKMSQVIRALEGDVPSQDNPISENSGGELNFDISREMFKGETEADDGSGNKVRNADENAFPCDVEPTLTFILQETGVKRTLLNNDEGFSAESIKELCDDVCNIKKKEPSGDTYIDNKGIGFKSVFRVSDAPEIHSNEFNIKFNKSDGLPTAVPPCDVNMFRKLVDADTDPMDEERWNTCILLPTKNEKSTHTFLMWIFSRLYPQALLFLHRLERIKYINLVRGVNLVMRKEVVGDGIVNNFHDYGKMTWFVKSSKLPADHIRHDVQTTEISMALLLDDLDNGNYMAKLYGQQAFAYIRPLSMYGLNFIIQADFIVSSIGEEIDADSPWNQWLLSEFPNLFVSAERSFCSLPCFKENQAKGVSNFMRDDNEWVCPYKVVRNWTEQIRSLLPDSLIGEHLDVGYLSKYTVINDSLAQALGIEECGPKFLVQAISSLCRAGSLKSMGLSWLSSWLNILFLMLVNETEYDVINSLSHLLFIPLLDGNYALISEGAIWLLTGEDDFEMSGKLYMSLKLRIVHPDLFSDHVENITQMLYKVGVQRLSAHEVIKVHILPAICDEKVRAEHTEVMIECLSFIMFHLKSSCADCLVEMEHILSLSHLSNHGYKRLVDVPIHSIEEEMQLFLTNKQKLLKLPSEESKRSMFSMSSLEEGKPTPTRHFCYAINVISSPDSTSKKFRRRSRRKTAPCLEDASKTNEVNSDRTRHEALKNQSGSRIYRDIVNSGKRWVIKVKEIGLASDFVAEDEGNGNGEESAKKIIECIRREEFGLDPNISAIEEDGILKKLNTRLGSGLHRLSQDLYSQDSNFLLELVQNADDNAYPCDVEPTLTFVLPRTAVIVLTNDQGFSVEAIKALCKDSSLSKKESSAGYIGKKGIGFKSVFQVTDAPEIHSNGFHVKFDIIDGPIDFVLPKIVPLFDVDLFCKLVSRDNDPTDEICWKTCIMLPFRSKEGEGFPVEDDLNSMFSSFHPSLLLFLHRLKCIKFRNTLNDSLIVMRKQVVKDGIVHIFLGKENFTWFVKSGTLQACHIRHDVQTTEISVALMLENLGNGNDIPKLKRQPDFALFPFRSYGLKFIIRADFVASSSREEVNEHSPWNQWLLLEFSNLFVNAELSFCSLPCFKKNPGKGVSVFMRFVPLEGEVHDTLLTNSLAQALGIEECGPKVLIQVIASLCRADSLKSMGLGWLSSWLNVLFLMLVNAIESDFISSLSQLPIIPLLNGHYASITEGGLNPHEIDISYLKQPVYNASPRGTLKWRKFFQELGVTDFVQIVNAFVVTCFRERMDDQLHFPKDLFHNCETLRDILGHRAPYTIPKDISNMYKFYTYLWSEMDVSKHKIVETLHFVPHSFDSTDEVVSGLLLTPSEVYWHDSTGSMKQKTLSQAQLYEYNTHHVFSKMLSSVYPGLCHFIVNECGVAERNLLFLATFGLCFRNNLFAGLSSLLPKRKDTGREGEHEAFKYFSAELGDKKVTWVNKDKESKLPYDILVEDGKPPKITTYRNLEKCCKSKQLQLAIHVLK
ncbi:histidine kinase-, DNA gyrase B-, and HSP90-like ATPase family protein [Tanacetum coccineum]|uniref:Histidine kinase-, DNA gyrase B-, and HSP90-like ATPase family protein n=1 Tax=Tanacetum coccineum TaxID=301880 RepID=A0ABQ5D9Z8_9ASTR